MLGIMNAVLSFTVVMACLIQTLPAASAEPCPVSATKYMKQFDPTGPIDGFYCGRELTNLEATLPNPLKVVAVGGLQWADHREIDLSRQKVSLDHYTNGDVPHGEIFIGGRVRLSGILEYEPGPAGDAWFIPQPALISPQNKALAAELSSIKILDGRDLSKFGFPQSLLDSDCFNANVAVEIDGIRVLIGETDEAGAYPINIKVLNVSGAKKCSNR